MTWHDVSLRAREIYGRIKARITFRLVGRAALAGLLAGSIAIVGEALIRAHLGSPLSRVPTTLYTRMAPWHPDGSVDDDDHATPIAIGTIDGAVPESRVPVSLNQVPSNVIQAILAVEDQRFYQHHGIDIRRIGGALIANLRAGAITQGGSTLTQQLAKNLFLSADRTPLRKLREAAMALVLEMRYTKAQILDAYLNEIYLGQDGARAIHGVGAAAHYYFGTDIRHVTLAQAAQLAGMISAPNRNASTRHPDAARERRDMVLELMATQHRIPAEIAERAEQANVNSTPHDTPSLDSRYFRDFAIDNLHRRLPARGGAVFTTLDAALQRAAERAVQRVPVRGAEVALVAIDPRNGEVLAMVGGRDYSASQFNRATRARRQPGSAFKPVVELAALEPHDGQPPAFTLASMVEDEPLRVRTPSGPWEPVDYDGDFRGPVTLREAMEQSLNVPFARVGLAVGPDHIVAEARRLGITSPLHAVPSLALGSSEVSLLELVRAYGVLAASGRLSSTREILGSGRVGGDIAVDSMTPSVQVVDSSVAYLVTSNLEGVVTRGTGRALDEDEHLGGIAGKTGTSSDWRDAWFVAYSPDLVVGVWVGFDDGRSLQTTGAGAALPVAANFLSQVTPDGGWESFDVPSGITEADVGTGEDGSEDCGSREVFLQGTEPPGVDCMPVEMPRMHDVHDWGILLERRAREFLQQFLARRAERHQRGQ